MSSADRSMISCLTITQAGRLPELSESMACFEAQSYTDRELVIVHDADGSFDDELRTLAGSCAAPVRVIAVEPGLTLGALRNRSVAEARGEVVCQWDDDDLYHPLRLSIQYRELVDKQADACLLTDQLHLFSADGELCWDDWTKELFPMCLIQGTLMARRASVGSYPTSNGARTRLSRVLSWPAVPGSRPSKTTAGVTSTSTTAATPGRSSTIGPSRNGRP